MAELEQTNVEPVATPAAEPDAPVDDFDELLRQFTDGTAQPEQSVEQSALDQAALERERAVAENLPAYTENLQLDSRRQELRAYEQQLAAERDQKDTAAAVATIRGSLDTEKFDDVLVQSWLISQANQNPAIYQAFLDRGANPKAFQKIVDRLASDFQSKYGRGISEEATADHALIAQAVRTGAAQRGPEPAPDVGRMDDREFAEYKRSLGIYG